MRPQKIKNKKITILKPVPVDSPFGDTICEYIPLDGGQNIWAYYRHASSKEMEIAMAMQLKTDVIFEIGWRKDIDSSYRILYRDEIYNISGIDDFEGDKSDLKISAYKYER